ncbi:MAG TPA: DUF1697 domain-containing protein [Verrucomicrobiae bacterium]|nr:DUF1697 domain-containing protein [Verrucomicrobiae bacterium]
MASTTGYVAFLRGVNVGGHALVKSSDLKKAFETLGLVKVTPVLASGNVVFETSDENLADLKLQIENTLKKKFAIRAAAFVRSASQIAQLVASNPFPRPKSEVKVHVTFLIREANRGAKFPTRVPAEGFEIVQVSPTELFAAVDLSSNARTPELMRFLEKRFGKEITTRTWNTVEKVAQLLARIRTP